MEGEEPEGRGNERGFTPFPHHQRLGPLWGQTVPGNEGLHVAELLEGKAHEGVPRADLEGEKGQNEGMEDVRTRDGWWFPVTAQPPPPSDRNSASGRPARGRAVGP